MVSSQRLARCLTAIATSAAIAATGASPALAAGGFGPLSGPTGCIANGGTGEGLPAGCATGKGLLGAAAVAVSPDGANVYVAGGKAAGNVASSFGSVAVLKRDPATGGVTEQECLSSDGTDGREGATGACTPTPSLLGADGIAVSPDGKTVFVLSGSSASVVAFARNPTTGALTRLGCFQQTPRPGAPCTPANLFNGSDSLAVSTDNSSLYVAAPNEGAISTFTRPAPAPPTPASGSGTAPGSGGGEPPASSGSSTSQPEPTLASLFAAPVSGAFLANPCIAVNGYDGPCAVGAAMKGIGDLTLSADGKQLYGAASTSAAVDVFTQSATGALTESGCLMSSAPQGLCTSSKLLHSPGSLAVSPDGKNLYALDSSDGQSRLITLVRNPSTGALSDGSCVEFQPEPSHEEGEEEGQEKGEKGEEKEEEASHPSGPCTGVAGLENATVVAVSGDGSQVYAIGSGSAAIFSRDPSTGNLSESSCAQTGDSRCSGLPSLSGIAGAAISPDGRQVYVAATGSNAVAVFGIGASVAAGQASVSRAGAADVPVICPAGLRRSCSGRVVLTAVRSARRRHGRRGAQPTRVRVGYSASFRVAPGHRATVAVRLSRNARRALARRRRLHAMAVVRANPSAGGSGYGRAVVFRLERR